MFRLCSVGTFSWHFFSNKLNHSIRWIKINILKWEEKLKIDGYGRQNGWEIELFMKSVWDSVTTWHYLWNNLLFSFYKWTVNECDEIDQYRYHERWTWVWFLMNMWKIDKRKKDVSGGHFLTIMAWKFKMWSNLLLLVKKHPNNPAM